MKPYHYVGGFQLIVGLDRLQCSTYLDTSIPESSEHSKLMADQSKLERRAPVQIGQLSDIDYFVTDADPGEEIREHCIRAGVELIIAPLSERTPLLA